MHLIKLFTIEAKQLKAPEEIIAIAQARWDAKQAKDWVKADEFVTNFESERLTVNDSKDDFALEPRE